jgi:hypothetical protein
MLCIASKIPIRETLERRCKVIVHKNDLSTKYDINNNNITKSSNGMKIF